MLRLAVGSGNSWKDLQNLQIIHFSLGSASMGEVRQTCSQRAGHAVLQTGKAGHAVLQAGHAILLTRRAGQVVLPAGRSGQTLRASYSCMI